MEFILRKVLKKKVCLTPENSGREVWLDLWPPWFSKSVSHPVGFCVVLAVRKGLEKEEIRK